MGLDTNNDIDGLGSGEIANEKKESPAEKAKSKKRDQFIQKTQKDEKKAKGDNSDLFFILSKFLKNPFFDELSPTITTLLGTTFPSRVILGLVAFVYPEATFFISEKLHRVSLMQALKNLTRNENLEEFHEKLTDPSIRTWMSLWITAWYDFSLNEDGSILMKHKLFTLLNESKTRSIFIEAVSRVIVFFFQTRNITMKNHTARNYADYITVQLLEKIKPYLDKEIQSDPEFFIENNGEKTIMANMLFGFDTSEDR